MSPKLFQVLTLFAKLLTPRVILDLASVLPPSYIPLRLRDGAIGPDPLFLWGGHFPALC